MLANIELQKTIQATLAADLAASGTVTVTYPEGYKENHFSKVGHKIVIQNGGELKLFDNFTVAFNAASAVVTLGAGEATIPAGSTVFFEFALKGKRDDVDLVALGALGNRISRRQAVEINIGSPVAADADGYCVSQNLTALGVFSTDATAAGALAAAALVGSADVPRNVVAAWTGTAVLTITGTDEYGNVMVESSASGTSLAGKKAFKTVTDISTSANITALTVGTGNVLGLPVYIPNEEVVIGELEEGVMLDRIGGGTVRVPFQIDETDLLAATPISLLCPVAGTIKQVKTMVWKAVGTGGTLTMKVKNTLVDGLSVVVANAAAAGDVDSDTPTAGHASTVVAVGDELELLPESAFATSGALTGYIEIIPTSDLNGTLVVGSAVKATATTGDVRGTYTPTTTPDGATSFGLLTLLENPEYMGPTQYAG